MDVGVTDFSSEVGSDVTYSVGEGGLVGVNSFTASSIIAVVGGGSPKIPQDNNPKIAIMSVNSGFRICEFFKVIFPNCLSEVPF